MESGFCRFVDMDGRQRFAALQSDIDRAEKHDRRLGSRREGREGEATARVGYDVRLYVRERDGQLIGHNGQPVEVIERQPLAGLEFEGEAVAFDTAGPHGFYIGVLPIEPSMAGRAFCGGAIVADIYLAGFDCDGLPWVSAAYISRDNDGRLRLAIPA